MENTGIKKFNEYFRENYLLFIVSAINFLIIYSSSFTKGYGYFIDEFYYIACANHPALGYVDHPPLAPLFLMIWKFIFSDSLLSIRFIPALASSITVYLTGILTKQLGGNKTSQVMASAGILLSPVFATFAGFYSMNVFEPLLCAVSLYYLIKILKEENPKYWIHLGVTFGLLLMNKHTSFLFIFSIIVILLFTSFRKYLFTKYFIFCVLITFLIFVPNIIWQAFNGFPSVEFYITNIKAKNVPMGIIDYLVFLFFAYNPMVFLLCIAGAIYVLVNRKLEMYRVLGLLFILTFAFYFISRTGRVDRMAYSLVAVIPVGAIFLYDIFNKIKQKWVLVPVGIISAGFFILIIPLLIPYLNYEDTAKLTNLIGLNTEIEKGKKPLIPQLLSDRIGWKEKVDMVGNVFNKFSDGDKKQVLIAAGNYGNAGALELYGKKYGFENIVCGHNNYYLWSKNRLKGDILLQLNDRNSYDGLKKTFDEVDSTGVYFDNIYCSPNERNLTVFICKKPRLPKEILLEKGKHFY